MARVSLLGANSQIRGQRIKYNERGRGACFRRCYNPPMLLPPSNEVFVPASEPRISIYVGRNVVLASSTGAGIGFHSCKFSNPASRSAKMPAAFCGGFSK
jgi:hypothetical protein